MRTLLKRVSQAREHVRAIRRRSAYTSAGQCLTASLEGKRGARSRVFSCIRTWWRCKSHPTKESFYGSGMLRSRQILHGPLEPLERAAGDENRRTVSCHADRLHFEPAFFRGATQRLRRSLTRLGLWARPSSSGSVRCAVTILALPSSTAKNGKPTPFSCSSVAKAALHSKTPRHSGTRCRSSL